jgi:hypothetical protein
MLRTGIEWEDGFHTSSVDRRENPGEIPFLPSIPYPSWRLLKILWHNDVCGMHVDPEED